tara:strand:- start:7842 stop:8744 length:903 start_codon:yes stop_codon:yes gene_type:complete
MAVQKEIWVRDISEKLFEGVEFATQSINHAAYISGKTVHVPQAGNAPSITKDRTSFPATISQRVDTDLTYNMAEFTTDPILVRDIEELQSEYDKRQSVLRSHVDVLNNRLGLEIMNSWAGSLTNTVSTTGEASNNALVAGATGTRKKMTATDVRQLALTMDNQDVPEAGRILVLPASMYYELFDDAALINRNVMGRETLPAGVIDRLFGFDIYVRNNVNRLTAAGSLKATQTAGATGDLFAGLAYHPSFVSRALGSIKVFTDDDKPEYYGSVMSAMVMLGASKLYTAETGIVTLKQTVGA